jgi:alanine dehydrogenase
MNSAPPVRLFAASEIEALLDPVALTDAVEAAFRARGAGAAHPGGVLGVETTRGGFHVKAASLGADTGLFAVKLNGNFPTNPASNGLPTIQGLLLAADVVTGSPLAIFESGSITRLRTAAASAVAIRHLAAVDAATLTIVGCGVQGEAHLRFALAVRPGLQVTLVDRDAAAAERLAWLAGSELGVAATIGDSVAEMAPSSDIIITCTASREPILLERDVRAGALVVAVGADHPYKQEIDPLLLARSLVVTDSTVQCATMGDLHHALDANVMRREDVHAELGEVVAGARPGRRAASDRIVFDSTGMAIQDAAAAALALERDTGRTSGACFNFRA